MMHLLVGQWLVVWGVDGGMRRGGKHGSTTIKAENHNIKQFEGTPMIFSSLLLILTGPELKI